MAVQFQSARSHDGLSRLARGLILLLLIGWLNVPCANAMDPVPSSSSVQPCASARS